MKRICVFCGSEEGREPIYAQTARQLGQELAKRQLGLVYGGGSVGLMGILADQIISGGGEVIGIIPRYLNKAEIPHRKLDQLIEVDNMFERKSEMDRLSDGFIVLPGGYGTMDELFEMVTLFQLKQHTKPIIICNINHYFDPTYQQILHSVDQGFIQKRYKNIILWATSIEETFSKLDKFKTEN